MDDKVKDLGNGIIMVAVFVGMMSMGALMCEPVTMDTTILFGAPLEISGKNGTVQEAHIQFTAPAGFVILTGMQAALS